VPSLRAWRVRRRRSTGCGSGRGSCCWQRTALRAGRLDERLDVQPGRRRSGGFATPGSGLRASTKRASGALSRSTRQRRTSASWRCWIRAGIAKHQPSYSWFYITSPAAPTAFRSSIQHTQTSPIHHGTTHSSLSAELLQDRNGRAIRARRSAWIASDPCLHDSSLRP
jgi:hypothetical protein